MNRKNLKTKRIFGLFVVLALSILPSCKLLEWFRGKPAKPVVEKPITPLEPEEKLTGDVIVSMHGQPLITTDSLAKEKEKLLQSNPQLKSMMAFMDPKQFDRNLSEGLTNQAVVDQYITDKQIHQRSEYQAELQEGYKAVERMINTKYFSQAFDVAVSNEEVRNFYEKNKDVMPNLLISRGGIGALGVQFDTEAKANAFTAQVREHKNDIKKAAQVAGLGDKVKDFKLVHSQSLGMDTQLRDKIVGMKAAPSVAVFKINDKLFWVINATSSQKNKYRPFEQVQNDIKQYLAKEKRAERFDEEITRLKNEYNVVIKEDYFKANEAIEGDQMGQREANNKPAFAQQKQSSKKNTQTANAKKQAPKQAKPITAVA